MKGWIRWRGIVPFAAITAALAVLWFLLIDGYVERAVEKAGTALVGAKVELDGADVRLFPFGLTLSRLQVTDPGEPMKNAVEVERIAFSVDLPRLLMRKTIIEEMAAEGIRLATPRKTSGALKKPEKKEGVAEGKGFGLPSLKLPDPAEVLRNEDLKTLALVEDVKAEIKKKEQDWRKRLDGLPDKASISEYEARIKDLKASLKGKPPKVLGSLAEANALKRDIENDLKEIKDAKRELGGSVEALRARVREAASAPGEDFERLRDKYGLSPKGLSNVTELLVGGRAGEIARQAVLWYGRLKPAIEKSGGEEKKRPPRGKGVDIAFREHTPLPDFLVRRLNADVRLDIGDISGLVENITPRQDITGVPITFKFAGEELRKAKSASLAGVLDHVDPESPRDGFALRVAGMEVRNARVAESGDLPVTLESGVVGIGLDAELRGRAMDASLSAVVRPASFSVGVKNDGDALLRALASVLEGVSGFSFGAKVTGTLDDYKVNVTSDLDEALKGALAGELKRQAAGWEKELMAGIREKTKGEVEALKGGLGGLGGLEGELDGRAGMLDSMLRELASGGGTGFKLPFR